MKDKINEFLIYIVDKGLSLKNVLIVLLFVVAGYLAYNAGLFASTHTYTATWDLNNEPDISHYNLFVWEGQDTLLCPFAQGLAVPVSDPTYVKSINHPTQTTTFSGAKDGVTYISVALSAADLANNQSGIGWGTVTGSTSHFLQSVDEESPEIPTNVEFID